MFHHGVLSDPSIEHHPEEDEFSLATVWPRTTFFFLNHFDIIFYYLMSPKMISSFPIFSLYFATEN